MTPARLSKCQCGKPVFFRNSLCLNCQTPLGFEPGLGQVVSLASAGQERLFLRLGDPSKQLYRRCGNESSGCNWLVPVMDGSGQTLCRSCRLNRTIPDLSDPENAAYWTTIEIAKARLVAQLIALDLPVFSKMDEDPARGLAFDFLKNPLSGPPVLTGHADGVITLNIAEADDAAREKIRAQLHEPYRTVLGHLRHEVGHYYWTRLIEGGANIEPFRVAFGDEREPYLPALERHYQQGPPEDWAIHFVSAYASAHPWEDWAETWAHYLHMDESLRTAFSFGIDLNCVEMPLDPFAPDILVEPDQLFLDRLNDWARFSAVLNEFARSMGMADFYPFVLSRESARKLHFVHLAVRAAAAAEQRPVAA
jgi:hypothetical protein